jgi:hypothetical protein
MIPLSAATSETLPSSAFESLLPKLLTILQVTQRPEGTNNVRNKQDLLQAVSRKKLHSANNLVGGREFKKKLSTTTN